MKKIVVMVSGRGTNLSKLIKEDKKNNLGGGEIVLVISSNPQALALKIAQKNKIPTEVIQKSSFKSSDEYNDAVLKKLCSVSCDLIVLAGFIHILDEKITKKFNNKIINIHPSLIPSFCGKGFYGLNVHKSVLESGVQVTGATVHFVNEIPDGGAIIFQKAIRVKKDDTPHTLQTRVNKNVEQIILPKAVRLFCMNKLQVVGNKTFIIENANNDITFNEEFT